MARSGDLAVVCELAVILKQAGVSGFAPCYQRCTAFVVENTVIVQIAAVAKVQRSIVADGRLVYPANSRRYGGIKIVMDDTFVGKALGVGQRGARKVIDDAAILPKITCVVSVIVIENAGVLCRSIAANDTEIVQRAGVPDMPAAGLDIDQLTEVVQRADVDHGAEISQCTAVIQYPGIEKRTETIEIRDFVAGIVATIANRAANRIRIWQYLIAGSMGLGCQTRQS